MSEKFIARKGDKHDCPLHGEGTIVTGFEEYLVEGQPVARVGDKIRCPDGSTAEILDNDCCMEVGGKKVARLGDRTSHGGKIISAASTTTAESNNTFVHGGVRGQVNIGKNVHFGKRSSVSNIPDSSSTIQSQAGTSSNATSNTKKSDQNPVSEQTEKNMWPGTDVAIRGRKLELTRQYVEYTISVSSSLDASLKMINKYSVNPVSFDKEGFKMQAKNEAVGVFSSFKIKNPQTILEEPPTLTLYNKQTEYNVALTPILITSDLQKYNGTISKDVRIKDDSWVINGDLAMSISVTLTKRNLVESPVGNHAYDLQYNLNQVKSMLGSLVDSGELALKEIIMGLIFVGTVFCIAIDSI